MRKGFTLIELLVVIAIIAVLAAILFPVFARAREKARQSTCSSNQRQIAAAVLMYAQDHEETLPSTTIVWTEINVDAGVLVCPTKGKTTANGYVYHKEVGDTALGTIKSPEKKYITGDGQHSPTAPGESPNIAFSRTDLDERHTGQVIACYVDGHVASSKIADMPYDGILDTTNVAKNKTWASANLNTQGWDSGLTDDVWNTSNGAGQGCFATDYTDYTPTTPKWVTVDLTQKYLLGRVSLGTPSYGSTKTVTISLSPDNVTYTPVGTHNFTQYIEDKYDYDFAPFATRYLRIIYVDHYGGADNSYDKKYAFTREVRAFQWLE